MAMFRLLLLLIFPVFASAQMSFDDFFSTADKLFFAHVEDGNVDYKALNKSAELKNLIDYIGQANVESASEIEKKAFRINAYNLLVISSIIENTGITSVQEVSGFFDRNKVLIEGKSITLNSYEKDYLLREFNDPRLHFVLVCGALDCPPIINEAYKPTNVEELIQKQSSKAINNPSFLRQNGSEYELSQIFMWYMKDFGGSKQEVLKFVNQFREVKIPLDSKYSYYEYDWQLNSDQFIFGDNASHKNSNRYVVSAAIPKGSAELKLFNNLYSQGIDDGGTGNRSTFFTAAFSALYGLTNRFNIGLAGRYRFVRNDDFNSSPLLVFQKKDCCSSRNGLTALGPQIRYAPFPALKNFSIQSSFTFPIGRDLEGEFYRPYIDWDGAVFNTQFFNDMSITGSFSVFTEVDILIEDIGFTTNNSFRVSTPVTVIGSYFPVQNATIYAITGFSPYWQKNFDYFYQLGIGSKYQFSSSFELELLYTIFRNEYLLENKGTAATYNLGVRYSL